MKRKLLILGMVLILFFALVVLTVCEKSEEINANNSNDVKTEEIMKDYTFEGLSFKLPSDFEKDSNERENTSIYNTEVKDNTMKLFSVAVISAEGSDFIESASNYLGDYDFSLTGYDIISKEEVKRDNYNGIETVSVDVKYNNSTVNGNAEVEYCYAQKNDTVYVICFEIFTQNGKTIETDDFEKSFTDIKNSLEFVEQ